MVLVVVVGYLLVGEAGALLVVRDHGIDRLTGQQVLVRLHQQQSQQSQQQQQQKEKQRQSQSVSPLAEPSSSAELSVIIGI